ncbi:MAG: D-cysteine desulfhydrase family protein [Candidatus Bipolaricaulis sp.]|nr:D-cysteine desulfhydrase family protein [Candidatus Bipolaricaulis sp.]
MLGNLTRLPRISLGNFPTPLHEAPNLSRELGGPTVYFKRDDETGLALGGNKVRKLEFIMPEAIATNSDLVITSGSLGSNHTRLTAAAARKLGMAPLVVLIGQKPDEIQGNIRLAHLLGAEIRLINEPTLEFMRKNAANPTLVTDAIAAIADEKRAEGKRPFVVPGAGFCPSGCAGYVQAAVEIVSQLGSIGRRADYVVVSAGSGNTYAGLVLGMKVLSPRSRVIGIDMSALRSLEALTERVVDIANQTAILLGLDTRVSAKDVELHDHSGEGYPVPSRESSYAVIQTARLEGILLDQVYTGKGMAGLMALAQAKRFGKGDSVVFVHTGGVPALFSDVEFTKNVGDPQIGFVTC